jgi:hypothetical protein
MKVIIRESRLMDLAVKFVNNKFPDLIEEPTPRDTVISYINPINNTTVFVYDEEDGVVMFYGDIYSALNNMFGMSEKEVKQVLREWLYTYYGFNASRVLLFLK